MKIPSYLVQIGKESKKNQLWVNSLSGIISKLQTVWDIEIGNPYLKNVTCSYVAPCVVQGRKNAVLKIGLPHEESKDEIEGLIHLKGNPTVKIFRYNKNLNSMLMEQCTPGTHLNEQDELYQDRIVCTLLKTIWETDLTGSAFRPLSEMVSQWNIETLENLKNFPDSKLAIHGCQLKEELIKSTNRNVLLATDLHAGNILNAQRKEWLAIDIKPYLGDPVYDLTQHIMNCLNRLSDNPKEFIKQISKRAEVDEERLTKWMVARLFSENNGINQTIGLRLSRL